MISSSVYSGKAWQKRLETDFFKYSQFLKKYTFPCVFNVHKVYLFRTSNFFWGMVILSYKLKKYRYILNLWFPGVVGKS